MKKHNKKRNTAFLFEALVRELTRSIVNKDSMKKKIVVDILKEHFKKGSVLAEELEHYKALTDTSGLDKYTAEKLLNRVRYSYDRLNKNKIFQEQSTIIKKINKEFGSSFYGSFVPNYKSIATLSHIFGNKISVKNKVLMERNMLDSLTASKQERTSSDLTPIDDLVVNTFAKSFNKKYDFLLPEQKALLTKYVISTGLNEVDFKVYVSSELRRIKDKIQESLQITEVKEDENMINSTNMVLESINSLNVSSISEKELLKIMKLQSLVKEYETDAN